MAPSEGNGKSGRNGVKLYSFWRSSAAYRVRIALAFKGLTYETVGVDLFTGAQERPDYVAVNPQRLVPTLVDGAVTVGQSLAIIEYLEEMYPRPPLLPADAPGRARVRQIAHFIAAEMHAINNLRIRRFLDSAFGVPGEKVEAVWAHHWLTQGLTALEKMLSRNPATGTYCHGDTPTMADLCLMPQVNIARRSKINLSPYPTVARIDDVCRAHPAFTETAPEKQPDYKP